MVVLPQPRGRAAPQIAPHVTFDGTDFLILQHLTARIELGAAGSAVVEIEPRLSAYHDVVFGSDTQALRSNVRQQVVPTKRMKAARTQIETAHAIRRRHPQTLIAIYDHRADPVVAQMTQRTLV